MFESQTYAAILQRLLDRVPSDIDKREGSVMYNSLAPAAWELSLVYELLDKVLTQSSGLTATGEYLDMRTKDYGVERKQPTRAVVKGMFYGTGSTPMDVPINSRFSASGFTFAVTEKIVTGQFRLQAETAGSAANAATGTLLPIDYVTGLVAATISEPLIPGTDLETNADLRSRYLDIIRLPSTSGNKAAYRWWALEVPGVGSVQVIPLWDGPGTVKVVLLDATKSPASPQLVDDVQEYIAPDDDEGGGEAPIGATVSVVAATGVDIDVSATVELSGSRTLSQVKTDFEAALDAHLKKIAFVDDPSVKYVRIGALLLDVDGVLDYSALTINSDTSNVLIDADEVAVMGEVALSE